MSHFIAARFATIAAVVFAAFMAVTSSVSEAGLIKSIDGVSSQRAISSMFFTSERELANTIFNWRPNYHAALANHIAMLNQLNNVAWKGPQIKGQIGNVTPVITPPQANDSKSVPEPQSIALLVMGLLGLVGVRRMQKA